MKLADAELIFEAESGPLSGLKLIGFSVWERRSGNGRNVTFPARQLELEDDDDGVTITHTIRAGYAGAARILDRLLRIYFSESFTRAMDEHVRAEFPKLRDMLHLRG